jgi:hypothetical protein
VLDQKQAPVKRSIRSSGLRAKVPLFTPRGSHSSPVLHSHYTSTLRACAPSFYPLYPAPPRPNTRPLFNVVGPTPLLHSPSPLHLPAWEHMLANYPGDLPQLVSGILRNGAQLGYEGPVQFILSKNLISADADNNTIQDKLAVDLKAGRVVAISPSPPYICSPLGLVPKHDKGWRRIHHLSHPPGRSVNDHIRPDSAALKYVTLEEIWATIIKTGHGSTIVKRDIQDAFRIIPVAILQQWLLGFQVDGKYYQETCLPFGLSTSPFLFNIFSEAFHWILESRLHWVNLHHYLDDFIRVIKASPHTPAILHTLKKDYIKVTDELGIPRNDAKDHEGQVAELLGIEHDTTTFEARLPPAKLAKAILLTSQALRRRSLTLLETQSLAGFLSFCAKVVRLGRTFLRNIWDFLASFPTSATRACRRSLPRRVKTDLSWWNMLLPQFNGKHLFDDSSRPRFHLYTDASSVGLGGFYFPATSVQANWEDYTTTLDPINAFSIRIPRGKRHQHINTHEMRAVLQSFKRWQSIWARGVVIIHTDNTATLSGLNKGSIRGPSMEPLRALLLLAAAADIELKGVWLASKDNGLADALSRFNADSITNWCPHWQDSALIRLPIFRRSPTRHRQNTPDSSGTAWILPPARAINRQSSPTKHSAPLTTMLLGPLQRLYLASGLLPEYSAPPLFKIWAESSQIRFKYISQRSDPTIPTISSNPTSLIAHTSNVSSKGLGMSSLQPLRGLATPSPWKYSEASCPPFQTTGMMPTSMPPSALHLGGSSE